MPDSIARPGAGRVLKQPTTRFTYVTGLQPQNTPAKAGSFTPKYGCFDREPYPEKLQQTVGLGLDATTFRVVPITEPVDYPFKKDCQYARTELGASDKRCADCLWSAARNPDGLADPS